LCDWATCNLRLHFSGTLLGSARRTGLLPVCGRNLYNCLCYFFFCSLLYPLHNDSELTQTLNYFRLWTWEQIFRTQKKKFPKTQFNPPPPSCGFSHLQNALSKSMQLRLRKSHKLLFCTQRFRVTTLRLSLHYLTWCCKISFLDHPLRIQICISQLF